LFHKNLQYYRLRKVLTKKQLAEFVNVTPMAISNYESGKRKPDMALLQQLAAVLDVRVSDFLAVRNENIEFHHGEFRKHTALSVARQEYVKASVEEYFNRYMTIVEILGGEVLPEAPPAGVLELEDDPEINAQTLRKHLDLSPDGPIDNLIEWLENKGILIHVCETDCDGFSGLSGSVNGRPYLVVNEQMSPERNRSTLAHELAHIMFLWPIDDDHGKIEKQVTAISGAFLFPIRDGRR